VTTPSANIEIKPQPPTLDIAAKNGALVVSWRDSDAPFVLEAQVDGQWSAVTETPTLANGSWSLTVSPTSPVTFFRLHLDSESTQSTQVAQSAQ
jgi:hypothetical protein